MDKNKVIIISVVTILVLGVAFFALGFKKHQKPSAPAPTAQQNINTAGSGAENEMLKKAQELEAKEDLLAAKSEYTSFISQFPNFPKISEVQKHLEDLNIKLIFSPILTEDSLQYEVKPKDTLMKIAKLNGTTIALIKRSNNLSNDIIRPGMKLKVAKAKFGVFVDKSQNILALKNGEEIIKNYVVSTGKNNSTPIGKFKVVNKLTDPVWFKTGAVVPPESQENVLGTRWLGFDLAGYGIHGTTQPELLGQQATQGCVRMLNKEVEELYDILPVGTEVEIVD